MCLLYVYVNDDPNESNYRLILANNRDEYWDRPTKPLAHICDHPNCFSSQDQQPGSEGGTWLAMSTDGKIGILTNILGHLSTDKQSRGNLVNDYLMSQQSGKDFIDQVVAPCKDRYNGFHLMLLDLSEEKSRFKHFSNKCDEEGLLDRGFFAVGNSILPSKPWRKCRIGKENFESIVNKRMKEPCNNEELVSDLHNLMSDPIRHGVDELLQDQGQSAGKDEETMSDLSAIFVNSRHTRYGTRTQSFIMVDHSGRCEFRQMCLETPVDPDNFQWRTDVQHFNIDKLNKL
ncbi:hypothetical protein FSP39_022925 [Pinctada imbricata]|uniref:Transport and golgi organization 2-like protein n=1 Tax=Pinctada imbricata TaxID=66713 RepID=A0AA88XLB4_PINIB|nr:hypothetical protein FSP39_022925 [Pinctada imbricata]